ncbi:MAG: hypothetical protein H0V43_05290 [Gemmatimonadales bacterium]|nr:hypothetical protein [Gemmatimonadales bacterium]
MTAERAGLPLADVRRQSDDVHHRLVGLIQSAPDEHVTGETRFRRRLRLETYGHYTRHARAIRRWRDQRVPVATNELPAGMG